MTRQRLRTPTRGRIDSRALSGRDKRYRDPESFARLNLREAAALLGRTTQAAERLLRRHDYLGLSPVVVQGQVTYDAQAVHALLAIAGEPNRFITDQSSWLTDYLKGTT